MPSLVWGVSHNSYGGDCHNSCVGYIRFHMLSDRGVAGLIHMAVDARTHVGNMLYELMCGVVVRTHMGSACPMPYGGCCHN